MSLSNLRAEFRTRTGDLNILDADIDNYINRGIKFLDLLTSYSHAPSKYFAIIPIGTYTLSFSSDCRAIKEVWCIEATTGRTIIEKIPQSKMRELYPDIPNTVAGKPTFYAIDERRAYPDTFDPAAPANAAYVKYINTQISNWLYRGIELSCPTDKEYMIEVDGLFNHPALTDGPPAIIDNWWTIQYPEAVSLAAMYHMELTYRNSEGANDYLSGIKNIITGIDKDNADEESSELTYMFG